MTSRNPYKFSIMAQWEAWARENDPKTFDGWVLCDRKFDAYLDRTSAERILDEPETLLKLLKRYCEAIDVERGYFLFAEENKLFPAMELYAKCCGVKGQRRYEKMVEILKTAAVRRRFKSSVFGCHQVDNFYDDSIFDALDEVVDQLRTKLQDEIRQKGVSFPEGGRKKKSKPLPKRANEVLKILNALPEGEGRTGPEIIDELDKKGISLDQSTLTKDIIPLLKKTRGVKNQRGAGYYVSR